MEFNMNFCFHNNQCAKMSTSHSSLFMLFLLQHSLPLFVLSLLSFSKSSPFPSLVSLNCTPPSENASFYNKSIHLLIDRLTSQVTRTGFITSTIDLGPDRLTGAMQCRHDLAPATCTLCAKDIAKQTILTECPDATAATAWSDGCYLQYCFSARPCNATTNYWSCSKQTKVIDPVQFQAALETLLLRLRADVKIVTHLGFSTGMVRYGNYEVYGLAECVHSAPTEDCETCIDKGIEKLSECCGGREGGTVVFEYCIVRYEGYKFFSNVNLSDGWLNNGPGSVGSVIIWDNNGDGGAAKGFKSKFVAIWGVAVACIIVFVFCGWLLRRSVINKAKVQTFGSGADQITLETYEK